VQLVCVTTNSQQDEKKEKFTDRPWQTLTQKLGVEIISIDGKPAVAIFTGLTLL
jgi:hypothetical protein